MAPSFSFGFASEDIEEEEDAGVSGLKPPDEVLEKEMEMEVEGGNSTGLAIPRLWTLEEMVGLHSV